MSFLNLPTRIKQWYWCTKHGKVEEWGEPTSGCTRVGPWNDKKEAKKWGERIRHLT